MAYSGVYKNVRFRSLLELSAIRHFEEQGMVLSQDFTYETVRIPYGSRRVRTYIVDLAFPEHRMLVEVKPESRADNRNNRAKRDGAEKWCEENGWTYVIVTDDILRQCGDLLTLETAARIPEVRLNERAKRALRRQEARRARKKRKK